MSDKGLRYGFNLPCLTCKRQGWFEIAQLPGCTIFEFRAFEPMSGTGWTFIRENTERFTFSVLCPECAPNYTPEKIDELVSIARAWKARIVDEDSKS